MKKVAQWFVDHQDEVTGAWINHFDLYNPSVSSWLNDPWISAMGEGQAISFLTIITAPLRKPTQNSKSHLIHIKLLQNLCSIIDNKTIRFYAEKWSNQ